MIDSRKWARLRYVATTSDFERMLRGVALRVTRPRVAVLSAVHEYRDAPKDSRKPGGGGGGRGGGARPPAGPPRRPQRGGGAGSR